MYGGKSGAPEFNRNDQLGVDDETMMKLGIPIGPKMTQEDRLRERAKEITMAKQGIKVPPKTDGRKKVVQSDFENFRQNSDADAHAYMMEKGRSNFANPFFENNGAQNDVDLDRKIAEKTARIEACGPVTVSPLRDLRVFRDKCLLNLDTPGYFALASYDRGALNQGEDSSTIGPADRAWNVLGGYDPALDMVLILENNKKRLPSHWIPAEALLEAIKSESSEGELVAFIEVWARVHPRHVTKQAKTAAHKVAMASKQADQIVTPVGWRGGGNKSQSEKVRRA